jgi:cell division protein FtsB
MNTPTRNQILKLFWILLTAGIFIFTVYNAVRTVSDMRQTNKQSETIDVDIKRYRDKITTDSTFIENMKNSPAYRETYAREELNMQREGETVYHIKRR